MKTISSILAAIQICLFAIILGGCSPSPSSAIEKVLNDCAKNTHRVNNSNMSSAQAAAFLASEMQKMDTRNCPPEFRVAFQRHINAWREAAGAFSQNTLLNSFLEGFASGITGDPSYLGASQNNAAAADYQIHATYNQLVSIAAAHGARISQ